MNLVSKYSQIIFQYWVVYRCDWITESANWKLALYQSDMRMNHLVWTGSIELCLWTGSFEWFFVIWINWFSEHIRPFRSDHWVFELNARVWFENESFLWSGVVSWTQYLESFVVTQISGFIENSCFVWNNSRNIFICIHKSSKQLFIN